MSLDSSQRHPPSLYLPSAPSLPEPADNFTGSISVHGPTRSVYDIRVRRSQGEDADGHFQVARKAKDFDTLRKLLVLNWPGVFVPPLTVEEGKDDEARRMGFEAFLTRVMDQPCLFHSKTMRLFLHSGGDFSKSVGDMRSASYQRIYDDYIKAFGEFHKEGDPITAGTVSRELITLQKSLERVAGVQETASAMQGLYGNYCSSGSRLEHSFEVYEADVLSECAEGKYRSVYKRVASADSSNPYTAVLLWTKQEREEITAMLDAVTAVARIQGERQRLEDRAAAARRDVQRLQGGKYTLGALLSLRSREESVGELEAELRWVSSTQIASEVTAIHHLLPCLEARLALFEIPRYHALRSQAFKSVLHNYAGTVVTELEEVWNTQKIKTAKCIEGSVA